MRLRTGSRPWSGTVEVGWDGQTQAVRTRWGAARFTLPAGSWRRFRIRLLSLDGQQTWARQFWAYIPAELDGAEVVVHLNASGQPTQVTITASYPVSPNGE